MKQYYFNALNKYKYMLSGFDALIVVCAIFISYTIKLYLTLHTLNFENVVAHINKWHTLIIPIHIFTFYIFDLYNFQGFTHFNKLCAKIILSLFFAGMMISGLFFFFPKYVFGRQVLIIHIFVLSFLLIVWRSFVFNITVLWNKKKRIALIASCETTEKFYKETKKFEFSRFELSQVYLIDSDKKSQIIDIETITIKRSLNEILKNNNFDILVFDVSNGSFSNEDIRLILEVKNKGKGVYDLPNFYESITGKIPLDFIDGRWLLNNKGMQGVISKPYIHLKRTLDLILSIILMLVLSPLILLAAILVKFDNPGKIIYSQKRLGKDRYEFVCYKFRTMLEDAEKKSGPVWTEQNDQRITKIGKFLRKTRLDELPQLWNIFKGDCSFVGPRPIRRHFADQFTKETPFYELRFSVQPGLSGWAQIHGCYAVPYGWETLKYELFYIQNMSLLLDLVVIFKTIRSFLKIEGR